MMLTDGIHIYAYIRIHGKSHIICDHSNIYIHELCISGRYVDFPIMPNTHYHDKKTRPAVEKPH